MVYYARAGKFRVRDRILGSIPWRGDETVLDVGTGRGLLLIGAAKRLKTGRATGIDIWSTEDLSGNRMENTIENARSEGVEDKITIRSESAQKMSFADATFDVVLSNLCLHNLPTREARDSACAEIARVLKPGGTALISDYKKTEEYAKAFERRGCRVESDAGVRIWFFPPLKLLTIHKPALPD